MSFYFRIREREDDMKDSTVIYGHRSLALYSSLIKNNIKQKRSIVHDKIESERLVILGTCYSDVGARLNSS